MGAGESHTLGSDAGHGVTVMIDNVRKSRLARGYVVVPNLDHSMITMGSGAADDAPFHRVGEKSAQLTLRAPLHTRRWEADGG